MIEILDLESDYGYEFTLVDDQIHFQCHAEHPDFSEIKPRLDYIRAHRDQAISYLCSRATPMQLDVLFWVAAEKAALSARLHGSFGHLEFARKEWRRYARLLAASMRATGATDPCLPWDEWILSFTTDTSPTASAGPPPGL